VPSRTAPRPRSGPSCLSSIDGSASHQERCSAIAGPLTVGDGSSLDRRAPYVVDRQPRDQEKDRLHFVIACERRAASATRVYNFFTIFFICDILHRNHPHRFGPTEQPFGPTASCLLRRHRQPPSVAGVRPTGATGHSRGLRPLLARRNPRHGHRRHHRRCECRADDLLPALRLEERPHARLPRRA